MKPTSLKALSPENQALVSRLYESNWAAKEWTENNKILEVLEQIGRRNEPSAIRDIVGLGLSPRDAIRSKAREVLLRLHSLLAAEEVSQLDEHLRRAWGILQYRQDIRPLSVNESTAKSDADLLFLALASCHGSGYTREKALRQMESAASALTLPFVIIRLTDWVAEVRTAATSALRKMLLAKNAPSLIGCLPLLEQLQTHVRNRSEYSSWIEEVLASPDCAASLQAAFASKSRIIRRNVYRISLRNPKIGIEAVLDRAIEDSDVMARKWAFQTGIELLPKRAGSLRDQAAKDPYGPIRRIAFDLVEGGSGADLIPFLLDCSTTIRHSCQSAYLKRTGTSASNIYREGVQSSKARIAILGLSETGDRRDAGLILSQMRHKNAHVRLAVLQALRILNVEGLTETLLTALESDVPSVAREAAYALLRTRSLPAEMVWQRALLNPDPRVHGSTLRLLRHSGKWFRLQVYLRSIASPDTMLSEVALLLVAQWLRLFNDCFAAPTPAEQASFPSLFENALSRIPPSSAKQLKFIFAATSPGAK